jgi:hypothetical protein
MPAPDVHADLEPLSFLLGTWRGGGDGEFPTIGSFRYGEEMIFEHVELVRRWRVDGDRLTYELDMATELTPLARHPTGELRRA